MQHDLHMYIELQAQLVKDVHKKIHTFRIKCYPLNNLDILIKLLATQSDLI